MMMKQLLLTITIFAVSAGVTSAQNSIEAAAKNARDKFSDVKNRSIELERMKRAANKRPGSDQSTPKFPEIKEDFEEIQKINGTIQDLAADKSPINYAAVLKFVSEINRRAARLKSNLFSVESVEKRDTKNKRSSVVDSPEIPVLLGALDKSIDNFVHSSLFQNVNLVVNLQDSLKAQEDLETVIEISFSIKGKAKKLIKEVSKK
jgi:hypothetical protein